MKVFHMSGAGNDFVVVDVRGQTWDLSALAVDLCNKTHADGFMALDLSDEADLSLHFYNPDGSRGELCGNGTRCACKLAYDLGIAKEEMTVKTDAGTVHCWHLAEDRYRLQLTAPGLVDLRRKGDTAYVELGDPGIPHCVTRLPGLTFDKKESLRSMAKALRHDPVFPKGVNVNLYDRLPDGTARILTYERGVEDFTLACGTGSASVAAVLWLTGQLPGGMLSLQNPGGTLTVTVSGSNGQVESLFLEGPAVLLHVYEQ